MSQPSNAEVMAAIAALGERMDRRFNDVDQRFNEVDERFRDVNQRFNDVDERFKDVNQRFKDVDQRFKEVLAAQHHHSELIAGGARRTEGTGGLAVEHGSALRRDHAALRTARRSHPGLRSPAETRSGR